MALLADLKPAMYYPSTLIITPGQWKDKLENVYRIHYLQHSVG